MPAAHEWASLGVISAEGLIGAPLVMRELGSGSRHIVENGLQTAGLRPESLRIVMELDSTEAILSCIEEQPDDKRNGERESEDNHEVHLVKGWYRRPLHAGIYAVSSTATGPESCRINPPYVGVQSSRVLCKEVP